MRFKSQIKTAISFPSSSIILQVWSVSVQTAVYNYGMHSVGTAPLPPVNQATGGTATASTA